MKPIVLIITLTCTFQIVNAQKPRTLLTELDLKGPVKEVIEYVYRGEINETEIDTLHHPFKNIMKFDENGNELEELDYGRDGELQSKFLFNYKKDKKIIKTQFVAGNQLFCTYTFKYDDNGLKTEFDTEISAFEGIAASKSNMIFKYDEKGNMIEDDQYNFTLKMETYRNTYLYNEKNQKIESTGYLEGNSAGKMIYKYDSEGRLIKSEKYDLGGKIIGGDSIEYILTDKYGNWLAMVTEDTGHTQMQGDYMFKHITKRVITYY